MNWDDIDKLANEGQILEAVSGHKMEQVAIYDTHVIIHWGDVTFVYLVKDGKIVEGEEVEE